MRGYFENSLKLMRFVLKRERIMSSVWIVSIVLCSALLPIMINNMFTTSSEMAVMAETMKNPAMTAMLGPVYGEDNYTVGAMYSNMMLLLTAITAAVMNIFLIVRHTRGDEEKGRGEVVRSLPVGRLSGLNAAMITAALVNTLIAVLSGICMSIIGIESMDFAGSLLFGAGVGIIGLFFAAVTALFSQLSSSSRGAVGYTFAFLGICYMLRAMGDIGNETLSLINPLGLFLRAQVYVENNWLPILIILILTIITAAAAYYLNSIRDIDQGFIPAKPGKKHASPMLQSSLGLTFRLLRNTMAAWAVTMFAFGAAYGSVMGDIEAFIDKNDFYRQMLPPAAGFSTTELFITMLNAILSICCVIPVVLAVLKLRGEEKEGRSENILSNVVSRPKYMAGFMLISACSSFIMLFLSVFGLWSASMSAMEDSISFSSMFKAMMVYLPAVWIMAGIAILLVGILPRAVHAIWAYLGFSFFAVYLGRAINMPEWLEKLTPFGYIPAIPVDEVNYAVLAALTAIAAILTVLGFIFYRKRDMMY